MLPAIGEKVYIFTGSRFYHGTVNHVDREIVRLHKVETSHGEFYEYVTISIPNIEAVGYD